MAKMLPPTIRRTAAPIAIQAQTGRPPAFEVRNSEAVSSGVPLEVTEPVVPL